MHSFLKISAIAVLTHMLIPFGNCASIETPATNPKEIRIVTVDPTPEPNETATKILFPRDGEMKDSTPIKGQIQLEGFPLGVDSEFERKKEIFNSPEGQSLHIFIDNQPYFAVDEALINALDDTQEFFDQTADFEIPFKLQPGMHVIRTFPVRSFNESLKGDGCFASRIFYYKEKISNPQIDLTAPYLTYNEPQGEYTYRKSQPILLDFYLTNCQLSKDGFKVRITIDNTVTRILTSWQPYYIYGLNKGLHRIHLELLDQQNTLIPGLFNDVERTIVIK